MASDAKIGTVARDLRVSWLTNRTPRPESEFSDARGDTGNRNQSRRENPWCLESALEMPQLSVATLNANFRVTSTFACDFFKLSGGVAARNPR